MRTVVLAAGKGVRMWPLTETRPKPLLSVMGRPLLQRTIEALAHSGASAITIVLSYQASEIQRAIKDWPELGVPVEFVRQQSPRGTADAIRVVKRHVEGDERFVAVYADNYYAPAAIRRFLAYAKNTPSGTVLVAASHVGDSSQFGRLTIKNGTITNVQEKQANQGGGDVIAGLYLFDSSIFHMINETSKSRRGEYELTDSLRSLINKRQSRILPFPLQTGEWQSISYPWDILEANRLALDDTKANVGGIIEDGVRVKGKLVSLKGSIVKSGCYLEGPVFIDEEASVGPNSYIRPYTVIGRGAHVGASCEIKNSVLMEKSKVPHLSYIGDSIIGAGVSLGAGTVTANLRFDDDSVRSKVNGELVDSGRRKLGAVIGDGVKTGIHVSIFPGAKIGTNAWVGPGVVIRGDVPSNGRIRK